MWIEKRLYDLKRNDIFRLFGRTTEYRVSFVKTELVGRQEIPTHIICYSSKSKRKYTFDLNKLNYYADGTFCEMLYRRIEIKNYES